MMLRDADITQLGVQGYFSPFSEENVNPVSYDVTLGNTFRVMENAYVPICPYSSDANKFFAKEEFVADGKSYLIYPSECILATTKEQFLLPPNIAGELMGKSTLGRWFLSIHVTAGLIDPGFSGQITLEIVNLGKNTIELIPGMRIGQMVFHKLYNNVDRPYGSEGLNSHYQNQKETTLPWG